MVIKSADGRTDRSVISKHIKNIFEEGELPGEGNVQILHVANSDKPVEFDILNVFISVGYRVKSKRGTQFRFWATGILKEYMHKGFALDDERLKNLGGGGSYLHKNLNEKELRAMGQLVSGYLDLPYSDYER